MKGERNPNSNAQLPLILGHEFSGVIVELGLDVNNLSVGQRVAVNPAMGCKHHGQPECELCAQGRKNVCIRSTFYGLQMDSGGFADEICVDASAAVPLPENVSLKLGALAEPMSVAAHMIRISGFQKGQNVIVEGAGPIGAALTLLLKDAGARVLVSEVAESRAAQAYACGADKVINPIKESLVDATTSFMAPGADIVFDACGLQATLDAAFECTKPGGTIFNVAIHERPLQLNLNQLTLSEKKLLAGNAYTTEDYARVIEVLSRRRSDIEKFISAIVPLNDVIRGAFDELVHNKANHNKILVEVNGDLDRADSRPQSRL
jgi:(R,R)-butanediol dehydrogenase / meso-butanediol dehydrogenase / diacetyl reductase